MKGPYTRNELLFRDNFSRFKRYLVTKRFFDHVIVGAPDDCWEWRGGIDDAGYGVFWWKSEHIKRAHQASYELFIGPRHGKHVLHKCDNPICVNPRHLWLGTNDDNVRDRDEKGRRADTHGEHNPNAQLNSGKIQEIRDLYGTGKYHKLSKTLARKFGVKPITIYKIVTNKIWKR
jgi:HNH endonuclease